MHKSSFAPDSARRLIAAASALLLLMAPLTLCALAAQAPAGGDAAEDAGKDNTLLYAGVAVVAVLAVTIFSRGDRRSAPLAMPVAEPEVEAMPDQGATPVIETEAVPKVEDSPVIETEAVPNVEDSPVIETEAVPKIEDSPVIETEAVPQADDPIVE